jgi:hypothetical protein
MICEDCYYHDTGWSNDQNKSCRHWEFMKLRRWTIYNLNYFHQWKVRMIFSNLKFKFCKLPRTEKLVIWKLCIWKKLLNFVFDNFLIWSCLLYLNINAVDVFIRKSLFVVGLIYRRGEQIEEMKLNLYVLNPKRIIWDCEVKEIILSTSCGQIGVCSRQSNCADRPI